MQKKIIVNLGIVSIPLKLDVAVEAETKTHTVCTGNGTHEPSRVKTSVACPMCGETHTSVWGFPERGVEVGKDLVVLDPDAIAATKGVARTGRAATPANQNVAGVDLKFHSRASVYGNTLPLDSVQNIYPDRTGEKAYALLVDAMRANPDLVAVMIWAPRDVNALWVLEAVGDRLVAAKRSWPEQVRQPAEVAPVETTEVERALFAQVVAATASDFEMESYVNEANKSLNELVVASTPEPTQGVDMAEVLATLLASIEAAGAKPIKAKAVAKKKVAA